MMDLRKHGFALFTACGLAAVLVIGAINLRMAYRAGHAPTPVLYSELLDALDQGRVVKVQLSGQTVRALLRDNRFVVTTAPDDPALLPDLRRARVLIDVVPDGGIGWRGALAGLAVVAAGALILLWSTARRGGGGGEAGLRLGASRARRLDAGGGTITFADVAGIDEARDSLGEIVAFLRDPERFERLGGRIPHGVLLVGPPGTGKTLLARAVAGEADVPFYTISGSDFVEMFVGIGASRVRNMFAEARRNAPCILFMDEIDAVGRRRGVGVGQGSDEREQTLNQLLVEMDGFGRSHGVILIAATNRPDVLDPALLRPGRFDREIVVSHPDVAGRERILHLHLGKVPLGTDIDVVRLARGTPGFSGADLKNLVNEAALLAVRHNRDCIGMREVEEARDTLTLGAERRTHVLTEQQRLLTAYREGGRAVVALHVRDADPVEKVSIVTRGRSIGMLQQTPHADAPALTRRQMRSRLVILLAGRAAEELVFGHDGLTSGTAADIARATRLAQDMVARWGLSDVLGPMSYLPPETDTFLHGAGTGSAELGQLAPPILAEMRALIDAAGAEAKTILLRWRPQLDAVARELVEHEILSADAIRRLLAEAAPEALVPDPAIP